MAADLSKKVSEDWKSDAAELNKDVPSHAVVLSEVDKKHAALPVTSLHDLFHNEASLTGNTFRTTFSVVKVEGAVQDAVKVYDKKTKKSKKNDKNMKKQKHNNIPKTIKKKTET